MLKNIHDKFFLLKKNLICKTMKKWGGRHRCPIQNFNVIKYKLHNRKWSILILFFFFFFFFLRGRGEEKKKLLEHVIFLCYSNSTIFWKMPKLPCFTVIHIVFQLCNFFKHFEIATCGRLCETYLLYIKGLAILKVHTGSTF